MGQHYYREKWRTAVKLKILIGALVFLIVVNLATLGSYIYFRVQHKQPEFVGDFPGRFSRPPHLDLDKEQRRHLFELRKNFEEDTKEISEEIARTREEIYQILKQDSVPMEVVEEKLQKVANLRMQIEKMAIRNLLEARQYLNPQQMDHLYRFLLMGPPQQMGPDFRRRPGVLRDRDKIKNFHNKNKE